MMKPSALYSKFLDLSRKHACPSSLDEIMLIRAPDAVHTWGHRYLVSLNPKLGDRMDNDALRAHITSTSSYLSSTELPSQVHSIIVDEYQRTSVVHMSYFLCAAGSEEMVEQDMIWNLLFTDPEEGEGNEENLDLVLIKESVEFIDAAASSRVGRIIRELRGSVNEDVRGGITLTGY